MAKKRHQFEKGNKCGGRKPLPEELKKELSSAVPDAIQRIRELSRSHDETIALRASIYLIDREYGKPKESHEITGAEGKPLSITVRVEK